MHKMGIQNNNFKSCGVLWGSSSLLNHLSLPLIMFLTCTWLAVAIMTLVLYLRRVYTTLSRKGVNHRPIVPLFGNSYSTLFMKEHTSDIIMKSFKAFPTDKVIGHYSLLSPSYIVQDLEMIKRIAIKDFDHFVDRPTFTGKHDPMFGRGLLQLTGDEWAAMRSTMSPAFTSAKIRLMVPFMLETGTKMIKVLRKRIGDTKDSYIDVETKDLAARYSNDVIASCGFGLEVDSQSEDNEFLIRGKQLIDFSLIHALKTYFYRLFPTLSEMLKLYLVPHKTAQFFTDLVLNTMKFREKNHIVRNDMIDILMKVKKGQLKHEIDENTSAGFATVEESFIGKKHHNIEWSDTDLVAQAILFLVAGYSTVSSEMSFLLYELAVNPDVQEKLVHEITEHDKKNDGKFDYTSIQTMTYMDMVISETLRLWPALVVVDRRCVKDYNIGRPNSKTTEDLIIRKGDVVKLPVWTIQHDPTLYPDPFKFDPERFSPENRSKINSYSYAPFGIGPRHCIGSRFALCELKVMLYQLLREMELCPSEKTCVPPVLIKDRFILEQEGGAWIRLKLRNKK